MSRKRKSKKNNKKSYSFILFLTLFCIFIALALYSYKTNPEFRVQVDETKKSLAETAKNIQEELNSPLNTEDTEKNSGDVPEKKGTKKETLPAKKTSSSKKNISLLLNLEKPLCEGLHGKSDHQIRDFEHYSICYRESYEQAEWSAYCLTKEELTKNTNRSDNFRSDPKILTGSATPNDYKKSGYDRGHLSPAADFSFDENAMSETFYMSNMSPQKGSFNRGIWKDLESQVRSWAKEYGRVYVVSGPVLEKNPADYKSIGENAVSVPEFYYKVILFPLYADENDEATPEDAENVSAFAFLFPNEKCDGNLNDYAVTVDEIENRTKLDFFSLLPDDIENELEKTLNKGF